MSDNEDIISSISKGCFFFKPQVIQKKRRKSDIKKEQCTAANYQSSFPTENKNEQEKRFDTYIQCWEDLEAQIKEVQDVLNETIFKDLLQYVQDVHAKDNEPRIITEIPTAALVTGVNVPDHEIFFSKFVGLLKEHVTPFVAQLQSKVCSNLRFLIRTAFDSLITTLDDDGDSKDETVSDDDDDEQVGPVKKKRKVSAIFKKYTFTELKNWYQDFCQAYLSTSCTTEEEDERVITQQNKFDTAKPPIVLIFEDFERFSPAVLQDFILICSEYIVDIPLLLIFGVNTAVTTVHRLLPHLVSSKLSIQKFQSQPSIVCLRQVIDKVIITDRNAFKLGPHVFRLLYEHFLYHDFSINNFVRGLKFCVMDHFNSHPSSIMCTKNEKDIHDYIGSLDKKRIDNIKNIPSFKIYIEKKSEREQEKFANDDQLVQSQAINHIKKLQHQEEVFYPVVKCLCVCTSKLPNHPLGKWLRDAYEYCTISSNITKEQRFNTAMSLLRVLSRDELLPILEMCANILSTEVVSKRVKNPLGSEAAVLRELIEKFSDLDKVIEDVGEEEEEKQCTRKSLPPFKSRFEFTENLKMAVKEKKKESPYEKLRTSVVDYLVMMFKKHLQSPLSMTFHEIFYYDNMQTVKQRLNGTPRVAIQKALSDPKCYLQCSCCSSDCKEINKSMPDICILYKLHLESGRLINLYDWLQAFISYIDPTIVDGKKKKSEKKKKIEEQLQARFIRGISELQFLGFIKGTRRKTDHVSRLTWGSC